MLKHLNETIAKRLARSRIRRKGTDWEVRAGKPQDDTTKAADAAHVLLAAETAEQKGEAASSGK